MPELTEPEERLMGEMRKRCSLETKGLLAIIDRLTAADTWTTDVPPAEGQRVWVRIINSATYNVGYFHGIAAGVMMRWKEADGWQPLPDAPEGEVADANN